MSYTIPFQNGEIEVARLQLGAVVCKSIGNDNVLFGHITALQQNAVGQLLLSVKWADGTIEPKCHPADISVIS